MRDNAFKSGREAVKKGSNIRLAEEAALTEKLEKLEVERAQLNRWIIERGEKQRRMRGLT